MLRNPTLIVSLLCHRSGSNSRSISSDDGNLIINIDSLLASTGRTLGALSTLSTALGLREERLNPLPVDAESNGTSKTEEDEVEEDSGVL